MWFDTGNDLVNLDRVARIAVMNDTHIEFTSPENVIIAELHFETAAKVNAAFEKIKTSIVAKSDEEIIAALRKTTL